MMQCNLNGQDYVLPQNTGIIFEQKSSIQNIISGLNMVQNVLIKCNPASQSIANYVGKPLAPGGEIKIIYDEEKYYLKFLPDEWNFRFTILQVFAVLGIILGAIYNILRFIKNGFKK